MKKSGCIFFIVLLTSHACYFTDNDIHEVEVNSTYTHTVNISSNLDSLDHITFSDSLFFSYEISKDTGRFYFADLYFDNYRIFRSDTISDSLWIVVNNSFNEGDYELTMFAYFKRYSGSLADILDAEFYLIDTSWTLTIKREDLE